jgi:hypothetical protein
MFTLLAQYKSDHYVLGDGKDLWRVRKGCEWDSAVEEENLKERAVLEKHKITCSLY